MRLTEQDVKSIKRDKRAGYVIAWALIAILALANLIYWLEFGNSNITLTLAIDSIVVLAAIVTSSLMNRKYNKDLLYGNRSLKEERVCYKEIRITHEAGSGQINPYAARDMKPITKYLLFILNKEHNTHYYHDVNKELYDTVNAGDVIQVYSAPHSNTILEIKKKQ